MRPHALNDEVLLIEWLTVSYCKIFFSQLFLFK